MMHQFGHMLEEQRLSMDQYLLMMKKSREEYINELKPDAEKRIQRQLVLEEIARQENLEVTGEELEALYNAYAQMGQELPRTEQQIRSLAISYRREKALNRLLEITAGPDPDQVKAEEEASEQNAALAAAAAKEFLSEDDNENKETVESEIATATGDEETTEE
jgi:trigger factor